MKKILLILFPVLLISQDINAQETDYSVHNIYIGGNYRKSLGNFGKRWPAGAGLLAGYLYRQKDNFYLTGTTGIFSYSTDEEFQEEESFRYIPVYIGIKYKITGGNFSPAVTFKNGINIIRRKGPETENLVKYHWQLGAGFIYEIGKNVSADINLNYINSFYKHEAMMTGVEIDGGIIVGI